MPDPSGQDDASWAESFFDALTAGAADRPESRVLDVLLGDWRALTEWEPMVGHGVRRLEGRVETRWIMRGRVLESRSFGSDGEESAKLLLAFDPTIGDYAAFGVHVFSNWFAAERGAYDAERRMLVFDGMEPVPDGRPDIHFRRTFSFESDDRYTASITYPSVPPGTYGPMTITHDRIA